MNKKRVIEFFGGVRPTARALGIQRSAVYQWPDRVPAQSALKVEYITKGKLKVDPKDYAE